MSDNDLIRREYIGPRLAIAGFGGKALQDVIAALPAVTVGVKPLVWRSNGKGRVCADTPFGLYEVEHGRYGMRLLHGGSFMQDDLQGIEAAKAAAQSDYEDRILAALEPVTPAPDAAAIREAALREAAALVAPKEPRPCDCDRCDCGNSGDRDAVNWWDEAKSNSDRILDLITEKPPDRADLAAIREAADVIKRHGAEATATAMILHIAETLRDKGKAVLTTGDDFGAQVLQFAEAIRAGGDA